MNTLVKTLIAVASTAAVIYVGKKVYDSKKKVVTKEDVTTKDPKVRRSKKIEGVIVQIVDDKPESEIVSEIDNSAELTTEEAKDILEDATLKPITKVALIEDYCKTLHLDSIYTLAVFDCNDFEAKLNLFEKIGERINVLNEGEVEENKDLFGFLHLIKNNIEETEYKNDLDSVAAAAFIAKLNECNLEVN